MPLPFLVGGLASIMSSKGKKGSVKEAVKRHNGNLEKLRIKETDCSEAVAALDKEELAVIGELSGIVEHLAKISNKPKLEMFSFANVKLLPYDPEALRKASAEPQWFLSQYSSSGSCMLQNAAALSISEDAANAWSEMEAAEKQLNQSFTYYNSLQVLAEQYTASLSKVREIYEKLLDVLGQFYDKFGKTDWNRFNDTEKFASQNAVQVALLLYEMCMTPLTTRGEDGSPVLNSEAVCGMMDKAMALCRNKGFEYRRESFDVVLKGDAKNYFSYRYRLEDRLPLMLPISSEQAAPILEKLRRDSNVKIAQDVTQMHARALLDKLRDVDIKAQRVPAPDEKSTFYADII